VSKEPVASLVNEDADSLLLRNTENNTASLKCKRQILSHTPDMFASGHSFGLNQSITGPLQHKLVCVMHFYLKPMVFTFLSCGIPHYKLSLQQNCNGDTNWG